MGNAGSITRENQAALNARGLEVKHARAALKARVRGPGRQPRAVGMAALADEICGGVPDCVARVPLDTVLSWVPLVSAGHRERMAARVQTSPARLMGELSDRQVRLLVMELRGERIRAEEYAPQMFVDVALLRASFERSGMTALEVARVLGWGVGGHGADGARVRRALGMAMYNPGHGRPRRARTRCSEGMALGLLAAWGGHPGDVGL